MSNLTSFTAPINNPNPKTRRNFWLRWLFRIGGTGLLLFFLWRLNLDWAKTFNELAQANLLAVLAAVLLVFPFIAVKAWRWHSLLPQLGINIGFGATYRLYALGLSVGSFTPGQSGDFIKAWYLKEQGFSLSSALISTLLDRLLDVAVLLLLAVSGLLIIGLDFGNLLPAIIFLLVAILGSIAVLAVPVLRNKLLSLAYRLFLRRRLSQPDSYSANPAQLNTLHLLQPFALTVLASAVALGRVWLLAIALGINLNPLEVIAASSLATVVSLLPVSVAGIGARDLALVYILGKLGYANEKAVSLATFILLLQVINLAAGYLIWLGRTRTVVSQVEPPSVATP